MTDLVDAQSVVQAALAAALAAAPYLADNSIPTYSLVPKGTVVPYVTIGDMTTVDYSTDDISGQEIFLNVHTWDQSLSQVRLFNMMKAVTTALHDQTLSLPDGFTNVNTRYMNSQTFNDPDGLTIHGVQRFRIAVQNTA